MTSHRPGVSRHGARRRCTCGARRRVWPWVLAGLLVFFFWLVGHFDAPAHAAPVVVVGHATPAR